MPIDLADPKLRWAWVLSEAEQGRPKELIELLRGVDPVPLKEVRELAADLLSGKKTIKKRRGRVRLLSPSAVSYIRELYKSLMDPKFREEITPGFLLSAGNIKERIGQTFGVSKRTIDDVLAKRKTYAEKKR